MDNISVEDGLIQASINYVFQDSEGFMWISTDAGVQTYDGYDFVTIAGPDNDFSSFSIYKVHESNDGLIWIDVYEKGLFTFDKSDQTYELMLETGDETVISHFIHDQNDRVWVATLNEIAYLDKQAKKLIQVVDLKEQLGPKNTIYHLVSHSNLLFIGTRDGVFVYSTKTKKLTKLPPISPSTIANDNYNQVEAAKAFTLEIVNQILYLGTNDGVFSIDIENIDGYLKDANALPHYQLVVPHVAVWQFYLHHELLLFGANEGLFQIDIITQDSKFLFTYDQFNLRISNNHVRSLLVDDSGLYWMGSPSDGIFSWDPETNNIANYTYQKGSETSLTNSQVTALLPSKSEKGKIWVGTSNGLNFVDLESNQVERIIHSVDSKQIYTQNSIDKLFFGLENQLWISTAVGLRLFDTKTRQLLSLPFSASINEALSEEIFLVHVEKEYLWFNTENSFFRIHLLTHEVEKFPQISNEIGNQNIWNFLGHISSNPNEFWFTTNLGLWKFDLTKKQLMNVYQHPNVSDGEWSYIDSVFVDESNDLVWIAFTLQGLIAVSLENKDVVHQFKQESSILDKNVYGVYSDTQGDIWVSSHSGIFMLNTKTMHLRRFGVNDGLVGNEFNSLAYARLSNGQFVYGAMNGMSVFDPILLKSNEAHKPLDIVVSNISLLSRKLPIPFSIPNQSIIPLNYDDVGIRIDFTTFDFSSEKDASFEYSINEQVFTQLQDNYILFPTLEPGHHSIQIRAKSDISGTYTQPISISFNVSYPPWRSPTAFLFYVLATILLISYWYTKKENQRMRLLEAHEQVKYRENRLQLALKGSNSDVWDWNSNTNSFTANRFKTVDEDNNEIAELSFREFFSRIHPDDKASFIATWKRFIEAADVAETFSITYRAKDDNNSWVWFKDLGKIVEMDADLKPERVTGSYTNITNTKVNEERAQYYGEAFRQTKDWVIIINQDFTKVTSNAAIREVFGWEKEEFPFDASILGLDKDKIKFYTDIVNNLAVEKHWRGEELITASNGQLFHVILNISVGENSDGNLHYIFVFTDITAQKKAENELRYLANYDHLTGLPNRTLLLERIEQAIKRAQREQDILALFFIDLDGFKKINDSLGHSFGDILLVEITDRLKVALRQDDTIARQGGDEFVVLLERFKSVEKLSKIAQKVISTVEEPVKLQETLVSVGCSIGIAVYPDDGLDPSALLKNSDIAMYSAKQNGRNRYQFYETSMNDAAASRLIQEAQIKQALKENEFVNYYQPIVDAETGKAASVELLLRWPTEEGMIPPSQFIPLAEDLNIIIPITEAAIKVALNDLIEWRKFRPDFHLSINISALHFIKGELVEFVKTVLQKYRLPANAIKLEITESSFISDTDAAIEQMKVLKNLGVRLALDDFGTGYSSLSYLKSLPIDVIKIDRCFISNIGVQSADEAIIETIIVLAKNLGMTCIAEGVETKQQVDFLTSRQCHLIQGYYYSKPVPYGEITENLS